MYANSKISTIYSKTWKEYWFLFQQEEVTHIEQADVLFWFQLTDYMDDLFCKTCSKQ